MLARDAGTPMGIFLKINHDNNHHLNSLWLQIVGLGAPPVVARALSIATGTAAIMVAGLIGARRSVGLGLTTALLFAVSPMFVTMGSEARGYAPMSLALLSIVLIVDRWLTGRSTGNPALRLAILFFVGAFCQLTIFFGFCAVVGWLAFVLWRRDGLKSAIADSLKLLLPSAIALGMVVAIVLGAAHAAGTGFQFGRYDPFELLQYLHALVEMQGYTVGLPSIELWWLLFAPILMILAPGAGVSRIDFYRLAVIGFPVMLAVLQAGNVGHARYYLVASIALLLLVSEMLWLSIADGGWKRWAAGAAFGTMLVGSVANDVDLIRTQRGDPADAIRVLQTASPGGARVSLARPTGLAMLEAAAVHARYPVTIVPQTCPPERFLFVDRYKGEEFEPNQTLCGRRYRPLFTGRASGLSGTHWTLYEIAP